MTESWQRRYGCDGAIRIQEGRFDGRDVAGDGPYYYTLSGVLTRAGQYRWTFEYDQKGRYVYQVRTFILHVPEDPARGNSRSLELSPEAATWEPWKLRLKLGAEVTARWIYNPGGEGIQGGWQLRSVEYEPVERPTSVEASTTRPGMR